MLLSAEGWISDLIGEEQSLCTGNCGLKSGQGILGHGGHVRKHQQLPGRQMSVAIEEASPPKQPYSGAGEAVLSRTY